jgi:hypothetical protein
VGGKRAALCVEAKAGEDFGPLLDARIEQAFGPSRLPKRANHLSEAVFGRKVFDYDERLRSLRYQLLHAFAGTAIEAATAGADQAAHVIHFFPGSRKPVAQSVEELVAFVREATAGAVTDLPEGRLAAVRLPGGGMVPRNAEVFVGWAARPTP